MRFHGWWYHIHMRLRDLNMDIKTLLAAAIERLMKIYLHMILITFFIGVWYTCRRRFMVLNLWNFFMMSGCSLSEKFPFPVSLMLKDFNISKKIIFDPFSYFSREKSIFTSPSNFSSYALLWHRDLLPVFFYIFSHVSRGFNATGNTNIYIHSHSKSLSCWISNINTEKAKKYDGEKNARNDNA